MVNLLCKWVSNWRQDTVFAQKTEVARSVIHKRGLISRDTKLSVQILIWSISHIEAVSQAALFPLSPVRFCSVCQRFVWSLNKHCAKCNVCPSKVRNHSYMLHVWLKKRTCNYVTVLVLPVYRTAESGSTAQSVKNVWNHVSNVIPADTVKWLNWLLNFMLWLKWAVIKDFSPLSLETLSVLWPVCTPWSSVWTKWGKAGLF